MKELDLLKKDWKRNSDSFEQLSENDIYKMIHKKSSSVVKWIFIVSIIELGLGLLLGIALSFTKYDEKNVELIDRHDENRDVLYQRLLNLQQLSLLEII